MEVCSTNDALNKSGLDCEFIWNKPKRIKVEIKEETISDNIQTESNGHIKEEYIPNYERNESTKEKQSNDDNVATDLRGIENLQQQNNTVVPALKTKSTKKKSNTTPKPNKSREIKNNLLATNLTIEKDDFLKCSSCYKCFEDEKLLAHHVWKHKGTNSSLFHQLTYKVPKKPNEKTQSSKKMSSLKCSKCLAEFDHISQLKIHIIAHIVDNIAKAIDEGHIDDCYRCEVCYNEAFTDVYDFKLHLQEHALLVLHKCQVCSKKFMDLAELDAHSKKFNHFTCIICLKSLEAESMINEHLEYHLKNKPKSCVYCKKFFYFDIDLNTHIKDLHFSKLSYKCDNCNDVFASSRLRCEHMWKAHYKRL